MVGSDVFQRTADYPEEFTNAFHLFYPVDAIRTPFYSARHPRGSI